MIWIQSFMFKKWYNSQGGGGGGRTLIKKYIYEIIWSFTHTHVITHYIQKVYFKKY